MESGYKYLTFYGYPNGKISSQIEQQLNVLYNDGYRIISHRVEACSGQYNYDHAIFSFVLFRDWTQSNHQDEILHGG